MGATRGEGDRQRVPRWRGERAHSAVPSAGERGMCEPEKGTQDVSSFAKAEMGFLGRGAQKSRERMGKSDVLPGRSVGAVVSGLCFPGTVYPHPRQATPRLKISGPDLAAGRELEPGTAEEDGAKLTWRTARMALWLFLLAAQKDREGLCALGNETCKRQKQPIPVGFPFPSLATGEGPYVSRCGHEVLNSCHLH
ncbi:hypothetical protein GW7_20730 [Heterocephalus glaber]|uniref:Uncharacterized protein n=1 Tax=Heterocephalus glaber TaxID=10181 RepID=G5B9Q4_HETGA|nr:hypothetical protein GW7_20730 [Heterocephalus glaber]